MKYFAAVVFLFCLPLSYSRRIQFYRKDYRYIQEFDAYYKIHWNASGSNWNNAFLTCDGEGASLFYPKDQDEWKILKSIRDEMTEVPNVTEIFVGLHDKYNLGEFITVDGLPTPYPLPADSRIKANGGSCISMNIDTGEFSVDKCFEPLNNSLPFVCKKVDLRVKEESCPTVDQGYKLKKNLKKCYKINEKRQSWQEAMKTCFMEGGTLAVIENIEQAYEIRNIIDNTETYFVGVKQILPGGDYYSVRGKKFSDMYQNRYNNGRNPYDNNPELFANGQYPYENDQYPDEHEEYPEPKPSIVVREHVECGTVCKHNTDSLYTETVTCNVHLPFICEMQVSL